MGSELTLAASEKRLAEAHGLLALCRPLLNVDEAESLCDRIDAFLAADGAQGDGRG